MVRGTFKKLLLLMCLLMLLSPAALAEPSDGEEMLPEEDWKYIGRFVLPNTVQHNTDVLILNHLLAYDGQDIGAESEKFGWYDVYYIHDHEKDRGTGKKYSDWSFFIRAQIIPMDDLGSPMHYPGAFSGVIITDVEVSTQGTFNGLFGVIPSNFRVYDCLTKEELFIAKGDMGSEELNKNSAAERILKASAPHPVPKYGSADAISGTGRYRYR